MQQVWGGESCVLRQQACVRLSNFGRCLPVCPQALAVMLTWQMNSANERRGRLEQPREGELPYRPCSLIQVTVTP